MPQHYSLRLSFGHDDDRRLLLGDNRLDRSGLDRRLGFNLKLRLGLDCFHSRLHHYRCDGCCHRGSRRFGDRRGRRLGSRFRSVFLLAFRIVAATIAAAAAAAAFAALLLSLLLAFGIQTQLFLHRLFN
ncbi:hypothetical protein ABH313_00920, partial [Chromobacterium vaccinii]|uniref:hypothetical protein n=1 Tax=Chromobacterium vaccinii TaxID=1108595 RepID=UPI003260857A